MTTSTIHTSPRCFTSTTDTTPLLVVMTMFLCMFTLGSAADSGAAGGGASRTPIVSRAPRATLTMSKTLTITTTLTNTVTEGLTQTKELTTTVTTTLSQTLSLTQATITVSDAEQVQFDDVGSTDRVSGHRASSSMGKATSGNIASNVQLVIIVCAVAGVVVLAVVVLIYVTKSTTRRAKKKKITAEPVNSDAPFIVTASSPSQPRAYDACEDLKEPPTTPRHMDEDRVVFVAVPGDDNTVVRVC